MPRNSRKMCNSFTVAFSDEVLPTHLKHVAALPWENRMLNCTAYLFILLNEKNASITLNFNTVKIVIQPITQYNIREVTADT